MSRKLGAPQNDIAGLSSAVAEILESEGSLAELGLFYANENIRVKLFAALQRAHYYQDSFIKHGLLTPLERLDQRFVITLDLEPNGIEAIDETVVDDLVDDVLEFIEDLPEKEAFLTHDHGHVLFLIFQIIHLFMALTKSEILSYIKKSGVDLSENRLKAGLYILQRFGLVGMEKKSSQYFYFAKSNAPIRVEIRGEKGGARIDLIAAKIAVSQYYQRKSKTIRSEKNRLSVIKKFVLSGDGK